MAISMSEDTYTQGLTWPEYLQQMTVNRQRILQVLDAIHPDEEEIEAARAAAEGHPGPLHILVMTEDWCGDAVVNVPVAVRLAEVLPNAQLRLFIRSQHPDLQAAYADEDVWSIPVISIFDGTWREIARFVEQSEEVRRRKEQWMSQFPQAPRWRASTDPEEKKRWTRLMARRLRDMMSWYKEGMWKSTWRALLQDMQRAGKRAHI